MYHLHASSNDEKDWKWDAADQHSINCFFWISSSGNDSTLYELSLSNRIRLHARSLS